MPGCRRSAHLARIHAAGLIDFVDREQRRPELRLFDHSHHTGLREDRCTGRRPGADNARSYLVVNKSSNSFTRAERFYVIGRDYLRFSAALSDP